MGRRQRHRGCQGRMKREYGSLDLSDRVARRSSTKRILMSGLRQERAIANIRDAYTERRAFRYGTEDMVARSPVLGLPHQGRAREYANSLV
jgi:hypothetical protein